MYLEHTLNLYTVKNCICIFRREKKSEILNFNQNYITDICTISTSKN